MSRSRKSPSPGCWRARSSGSSKTTSFSTPPFLAGPAAARVNRARDEQKLFFKQHPTASERDCLPHVFDAVGHLPGMREFFDRRHNPLWLAGPTGDALAGPLDFWRKTTRTRERWCMISAIQPCPGIPKSEARNAAAASDESAVLLQPFNASTNHDPTRFLGDLYQDLSEFARKRYALLQMPEFVEQCILDRTLTPAIDIFSFRVVRLLDLTCGSGDFLLGGFDRLFKLWQERFSTEARRSLKYPPRRPKPTTSPFSVS